jgi:hypothetical protein
VAGYSGLDTGIGLAGPARPARRRRGSRALGLYPLEPVFVAMGTPRSLGPRWALPGAILSASTTATAPVPTLARGPIIRPAALVGLTCLRCGRWWLAKGTPPGAVSGAGGLAAAFALGRRPVASRLLSAGAVSLPALRLLILSLLLVLGDG